MDRPAFRRILVPIDGSPSAEAAVGLALHLADGGGSVVFAHAINRAAIIGESVTPYGGDPTVPLELIEQDEGDLFKRETQRAADVGIPATTLSLDGVSYDQIARAAREQQVDAIVMGTRGLGGLARLVGSTAQGVLRLAVVPTIIVRDGDHLAHGRLRCILAAIDESETSRDAAYLAVNLAARDGGSVVFVHVAQSPDDHAAAVAVQFAQEFAHERGVHYDTAIVHGHAADAIRISAEVCHADAIAVGTHGRRGFERLVLGSVAEAVIRESTVPVIVVPTAAARSDGSGSAIAAVESDADELADEPRKSVVPVPVVRQSVSYVGTVHAEIIANCPFSIAGEYASDYLKDAERGNRVSVLRAGPLGHRVTLGFRFRTDTTEPGRPHDEILLDWSAGTAWLPNFRGTLRMRINGERTRLILDGNYAPPGGPLGVLFDAIGGSRMARATANDLLRRIAGALEDEEILWEKRLAVRRTVPRGVANLMDDASHDGAGIL
jgi:nucleotide-binding universal stress UspA family protein